VEPLWRWPSFSLYSGESRDTDNFDAVRVPPKGYRPLVVSVPFLTKVLLRHGRYGWLTALTVLLPQLQVTCGRPSPSRRAEAPPEARGKSSLRTLAPPSFFSEDEQGCKSRMRGPAHTRQKSRSRMYPTEMEYLQSGYCQAAPTETLTLLTGN
jgi:hypothetical protein